MPHDNHSNSLLFVWRSQYLANYGEGWIAVAARDVYEARQKARENFETDIRVRHEMSFLGLSEEEIVSDEHYLELRAAFEVDIGRDPEILYGALFVPGSD